MTLSDLYQRVNLKLGEQSLFYPQAEIIRGGLNPANRLLCLAHPALLQQRVLITVAPEEAFVDLRQTSTRIRRVRRVVLGDMTGEQPVLNVATGEYRDLTSTSVGRLASQANWFTQRGTLDHYWQWGPFWLGFYRRPFAATTITVIFDATPTPFDEATMEQEPEIDTVHHPRIADIAAGLLLLKEGQPQASRGVQWIQHALSLPQ